MTIQTPETSLSKQQILERARALIPLLKEHAQETEQARRVLDEVAEQIIDSKLLRLTVPKRFGGLDNEFSDFLDASFELSRGCSSSGWCYALWGIHSWWVGYYPPEAQEDVFSTGPDTLISTANFVVKSVARPVPGGFRLSGHWQFSTGCDHVSWIILTGNTPDGPLGMLVPKADFQILQDTWYVSGLQGTGSKDIVVDDAFVPIHRTISPPVPLTLPTSGWTPAEYHQQRRYTVPIRGLLLWDLVAPGLGIAQAAVDEFITRMYLTGGRARSAESALVQAAVAESAAEIDAALALMHKDVEDVQSKGERGEELTPLDMATYSRDRAFGTKMAMRSVGRLFDLVGAHALYSADRFQRIHRDVQAAGHRDGLVLNFAGQQYGRAVLGLDPDSVLLRAPAP